MSTKDNINKLFTVLVLGGSILGQTQNVQASEAQRDTNQICQIELTLNSYSMRRRSENKTVCLDQKTDAEVLEVLSDFRDETCMTPFCGCWLG